MINLTLSDQLLRNQSRCDQTFGEIFQINHCVINCSAINLLDQSRCDQTFGEIGTINHLVIDCGAIDLTKSD